MNRLSAQTLSTSRVAVCAAFFALTLFAPLGNSFALAPAAPPVKKTTKKTPVKKRTPAKKRTPTKKVAPLKKPIPKPSPVVVIPAPKTTRIPAPVPVSRPILTPLPAPVSPTQKLTPAQMNAALPVGSGTLTLEKAETTDQPLPNLFGPNLPDPGTRYVVFYMRVKNETQTPLQWSLNSFNPQLTTKGGGQVVRGISLLTAKNDKFEEQPIQPGEEKLLRFHFQVPQGTRLQTLTLGALGGPTYQFDVSNVQ